MANAFNLTAQLNLQGPANITSVVNNIRRQLGNINANVNVVINPNTNRNITALNSSFQTFNRTLRDTRTVTRDAASAITALGRAINQAANPLNNLNVNLRNNINATAQLAQNLQNTNRACNQAGSAFESFGRQAGNAIRRAAAFSTVAGLVYKLGNSFNAASKEFIEFNKELVRVAQVTDTNLNNLGSLVKQITDLSTSLGVSSSELIKVSSTLAQAGLSAKDTEKALKAVARSALAPSFDSMNDTVEGSIALMRQFGIEAGQLEGALGSINAVSAKFAVEASDLITAIQRTGGVFASASKGVSSGTDALNEFLAIFTSIRATTRESAETIATGLRTIFARIQRSETIENLQRFGVLLTDLEGKFVGPYEAVRRLSEGLSRLDPRDLRFAEIVEELGGFRQIGKVIPLIQQFAVSQQALKVAQSGQASLAKDIAVAQESVANKITKVREEFIALIRSIGESQNFQTFVKLSLDLASALIKLADAAKNVLPAIAAVAAIRSIGPAVQYGRGFVGGLTGRARRNNGGPIGFASGGFVPGQGNSDTIPAMLTPGEFVIRKKAVQALGAENLHRINKYAGGGKVTSVVAAAAKNQKNIEAFYGRSNIEKDDEIFGKINTITPDKLSKTDKAKLIASTGLSSQERKLYGDRYIRSLLAKRKNLSSKDKTFLATKGITNIEEFNKKTGKAEANMGRAYEKIIISRSGGRLSEAGGSIGDTRKNPNYPVDVVGGKRLGEIKFKSRAELPSDLLGKLMSAKLIESPQKLLNKFKENNPSDIDEVNIGTLDYYFVGKQKSSIYDLFQRKNLGGLIQRFAGGKSVEKMGRAELIKLAQKYGIRTDYNILGKQNEAGENARQQLRQAIQTELDKESSKAVKFSEKAKKKTIAIGGLGGMRESLEVAIPTGKGKQSPATLMIGSLDPVIAKRVQAIIRNGLERLVQSTADVISKSAGIPKTANRKLRRSITAKDIDDGAGFVYERALGLAAGNFDTTNKSIDFPKGIGKKEIADLLGIPSDVPTDITASRDLRGTSLRKAIGSREGKLSQFARGLKKQKFANGGLAQAPLIDDIINASGTLLPRPGSAIQSLISAGGGAVDVDRTLKRTIGDKAYGKAKTGTAKSQVLDKYFRGQERLEDIKSSPLTQFGKELIAAIRSGKLQASNLSIITKSKRMPGVAEYLNQLFGIPVQNMIFTQGGSKQPAMDALRSKGPRINRTSRFANGGLAKTKQKQLGTQDILLSLLKSHPFFIAPQTLIGRVGRQEGIENTLKSIESTYGIKNAKILASGAESVVFDIGKKILKISEKNNVYDLPKISGVAGYTKIKKFGLLTAALQEKLALDKYGTSKDVDLLKRKMKKRGLIWSDAHELNIGYDKKNRPKIIDGSIIRKFTNGGSPTDTVPALLTPGEFVINKKAASRIGLARLHELNRADKIQGYAKGGSVQRFATGGEALRGLRSSDPQAFSGLVNTVAQFSKQSQAELLDFIRHLNSLDRPLQEVQAAIIAWVRATHKGADSIDATSKGMSAASKAATSQGVDLTTRNPSKPQSQLLIVQDFNNAVNKVKQGFSQIPSVLKNFQGSLSSSTSRMMNFSKSIIQNPFSALSKAAIAASNSLYSVAKAGASNATQSIGGSLLSMIGLGGLTTAGNKPGAKFAAGRKAVLARRAGGMGGMGGMGASILGSLVGETIIQGAAGLAGGEKTAAGRNISNVGSSALSYGLLGAQIGSVIPGVGTVIGGIAGGLAGGAMGYMGSQKQGREYEIQKQQELVDSAVERSTKDISAYAGLEAGSPRATEARKKAIESLTATSKAEEGLLSKTQQEKGFLGFGAESNKDYMQRRIKVEEAGAAQAEQLLSTEMVKTGKTFQELSKTLDPTTFKTLTANIAEADMEYASKRYAFAAQIDKLKSEGKLDEANKLQAVANQDLADLAVTITERKTAEQNAAIEAQRVAEKSRLLSLQMVKLALSLQDATEIMSQSLSRASFEIEDAAKNIGSITSGKQSLTSGGTARDINVLENPKAYSEQERRMAGIRSTAVLGQQANYVNRLAEFSTTAKERALSEGNLQFAQRTGDVQLDNQKISNAIRTQLTNSIDETFGNTTIAAGLKSSIQKNIDDALKDAGTTIDPQQLFDQIAGPIIQASEKAEQLRLQSAKLTAQALDYLASSAQELANIELKRADRLNKLNEMRASTGLQLREAMGGKVSARERTSLRLSGVSSRLGLGNRPVTEQTISGLGSQARGEASVLKQQIDQLSPFAATSKQASDQLLKLKTQLAMVNSTIDKTDQALEDLPNLLQDGINDTINEIQQRVSEIESARQAGTSFAEKLVTSTPQELNELNNSFNLMNNTLNGNITTINRSVGANQAYYEALRQGKNAQEAMNDAQTAFANENKNALQLFDELTKIAGVSGPQFDQMKATLLENFAVSQGAGLQNNPFFKEIIAQLRTDPAQRAQNDPVVQALRANVRDMQIAQVQAVNEANRVDREAQASLLNATSNVILNSFINVGNRITQSLALVVAQLGILAGQQGRPPAKAGNKAKGGLIYASKGTLVNFEPKGTDTVPAMLTPGEFVVNAKSTKEHLPLLQSINKANGGMMPSKPMAANPGFANMFFGNRNMINMYQGTTPYQEAYMRNMKGERISVTQVMMERANRMEGIRNQKAGMYNSMMRSRYQLYQQRRNANRAMRGLPPKRFNNGGLANGTDIVPAMLTPGEFVVNKASTKKYGGLLKAINNHGVNYYQSGGIVGNKSIIKRPNYYSGGADNVTANTSNGVLNIGSIEGFAAKLDEFVIKLQNAIPSTINVQGKHDVNVIINGAGILQNVLGGPIGNIVEKAIINAFAAKSRQNEGSTE